MLHLGRRQKLLDALSRVAMVHSEEELVTVLRATMRSIADADGIAIIRREGDQVRYIAEDSKSPLWSGQSFPIESCISGIAMLENQPVLIPDIYRDARVPIEAYEPTFVRSVAMFPIGLGAPRMAMGAYWSETKPIDPETVTLLSSLARSASSTFERVAAA